MTTIESAEAAEVELPGRASSLLRSSGPGFQQCWYPVSLAADLAPGQVKNIELGDGRIALYRGESGTLHAMVPYCKHMGSDLSVGEVVGESLRCAFHHWHYGPDGVCNKIPSGDRIPRAAKLATFPVEESNGLIWVFWGREALYPVPDFDAGWNETPMKLLAFEGYYSEPLRVEPWAFTMNIYDIVHNQVVHGIMIDKTEIHKLDDYHTTFAWSAEMTERDTNGSWSPTITVFATNGISSSGEQLGRSTFHLAFNSPMGSGGTRTWFVVATPDTEGAAEHLEVVKGLHNRVLSEDLPILNTLKFGDDHLVASDRAIASFLRYSRDYPRATYAELEQLPGDA